METLIRIAGILIAIVLLLWLGLKIKPEPYPVFAESADLGPAPVVETMAIPDGLPAPVERFYRQRYGEKLPVITSAVISGRGTMAPFGIALPMRFRFAYGPQAEYRALIEATIFTLPLFKADETYIDAHALGKMPYGIDEGDWFNQAMNVRIWCEILTWLPSALLTAPGVSWEPVDAETALLVVPFNQGQERVVVRFDPQTGLVRYFETMKYRTATEKILWINSIWVDQGKPWIHLTIEETLYNVPLAAYIRGQAHPQSLPGGAAQ